MGKGSGGCTTTRAPLEEPSGNSVWTTERLLAAGRQLVLPYGFVRGMPNKWHTSSEIILLFRENRKAYQQLTNMFMVRPAHSLPEILTALTKS
jgi:hypothetical protein